MISTRWQMVVLVVAGLGVFGSLSLPDQAPASRTVMELLAQVDALLEDRPAPRFAAMTLEQDRVYLSQYQGELVYLNYWGRFCDVCRAEMPSLDAFAEQYQGRIRVVTVAIDQDTSLPRRWLAENFPSPAFDVLLDPGGESAESFGTRAVPETYILTPDGHLLARLIGGQDFLSEAHRDLADELLSAAN